MAMTNIRDRLQGVQAQIESACAAASRDPSSVNLLAVSKTKPLEMVTDAISCGQLDFGENYLQDALEKISAMPAAMPNARPVWHYIGAIQSNKTRDIAAHFDWVHTVASEKVARRLNNQRPVELPPLKVLIQVNLNQEAAKAGIAPEELSGLVKAIQNFNHIELVGLMAIPEQVHDVEVQRANFHRLAALQALIKEEYNLKSFTELSMGMSGDLDAAIAEGATWVRIGTAIFGERVTQ